MKILLLPGMDGTGVLFKPFTELAPPQFEVHEIQLLQEENVTYEMQAERISKKIDGEVIIVAESYSGMIAIELLKMAEVNIKHVFFVASFLEAPSHLSKLGSLMPTKLISITSRPSRLLYRFLFGRFATSKLSELFTLAMNSVDAKVLKYRLGQISKLSKHTDSYSVPCTYIRANQDNLVSTKAIKSFEYAFASVDIKFVDGTHFALQTNPVDCWKVIENAFI